MNKSLNIEHEIKQEILEGILVPDQKMPTEHQLALKYEVNRHTIRKVIESLVTQGYLRKGYKTPTFVNRQETISDNILNYASMSNYYPVKTIRNDVVAFEKIKATDKLCAVFNSNFYGEFWHIKRVRKVENKPPQLENIFMPYKLFPTLTKTDAQGSLYAFVGENNPAKINYAIKEISAIILSEKQKDLLETKISLGLQVATSGYLSNGRMFEYSENIHIENKVRIYQPKK